MKIVKLEQEVEFSRNENYVVYATITANFEGLTLNTVLETRDFEPQLRAGYMISYPADGVTPDTPQDAVHYSVGTPKVNSSYLNGTGDSMDPYMTDSLAIYYKMQLAIATKILSREFLARASKLRAQPSKLMGEVLTGIQGVISEAE